MLKLILLQAAANNETAYNAGYHVGYFIGENRYYILGAILLAIVLAVINSRRKRRVQ